MSQDLTDPKTQSPGNAVKDPDDWTTGDEQMTGAQASYLKTLSEQAGEPYDANLTKADASKRIDDLQAQTGRDGGEGTDAERRNQESEQRLQDLRRDAGRDLADDQETVKESGSPGAE